MTMDWLTYSSGRTWFVTHALQERHGVSLLVRYVDLLRESVARVCARYPFEIHAWVVLPEHLHCILQLPPGDTELALRWRLICAGFAQSLPAGARHQGIGSQPGVCAIWQRRYREFALRDERDWRVHLDYVHANPVRHGWVEAVRDWPYSSFQNWVRCGRYAADWVEGTNAVGRDGPWSGCGVVGWCPYSVHGHDPNHAGG